MVYIKYLYTLILSTILTIISGKVAIPLLRRLKAGQPIYEYVETHKDKKGTPTMGGLFFIIPSVISFLIFSGFKSKTAIFSTSIGLGFMLVGFLDDFIKIRLKRNQGLKAYQKIIFQLVISILAGVYVYVNGYLDFNLPFSTKSISLGVFTIPFVALIFVATTNCVNLTDGLDGLATTTSISTFSILSALILLQINIIPSSFLNKEEITPLVLLSFSLLGGCLGFLKYNVSKAKVFMGDTGSLSLGAFIASIAIFSGNALFIPLLGIMFVITGISVIIQVLYYKKTKKRIFLMAPLHHHLELKGKSESEIGYLYFLISTLVGLLCISIYLWGKYGF